MRTLVMAAVLSAVCAPTAFADTRLDTPQDLANLRATNFEHYQRAERIIAAANTLCRPGLPKVEQAKFGATDLSCAHLLLTSLPAKREIAFKLDGTRYVALVTITANPARVVGAN
jgi:hypothetical protein